MLSDRRGFSLPEMLIALAILGGLTSVTFGLLSSSQSSYHNAEASIQVRDILRKTTQRIAWELSHSGYDGAGVAQFTILTGAGSGGSDKIRFSVPVSCDSSVLFLDANGRPLHWGAYLTWGCDSVACADTNGVCASVEYKYVQYALNANGQIVRSVLAPDLTQVVSQVIAERITGLTFTASGIKAVTFAMTGQMRAGTGQMITTAATQTVHLMN